MIQLKENEYYKAMSVFENISHNRAIVFSILEGNNPGRLFVNQDSNPTAALICTPANFFYFGGNENDIDFIHTSKEQIVSTLKYGMDKTAIIFSFSEEWRNKLDVVLKDKAAIRIIRNTFNFDQKLFDTHKNWQDEIKPQFSLKAIDRKTAEVASVSVDWGSVSIFMDKSFGFRLLHDKEILSECHLVYIGNGEAEISVFTEEKYRRQGFAMLTVCAVIEKCISRGLKPSWTCWKDNKASYSLAHKVGFVDGCDVQAHYWADK